MTNTQPIPLTTPEEVQAFLSEHATAAIFKAGTCHKTMQGFAVLESFLARHELPVGFIRVVDWRPASDWVAAQTGIVHHSPQIIIFKEGEAKFEANNWDITPERLAPAFAELVPLAEQVGGVVTDDSVQPYIDLIDRFLNDEINEFVFQDRWVNFFRDDAQLRSQKQFESLSRLFGDPDAYHGGLHNLSAPTDTETLKARVRELRAELLQG